jgi:hypothetical protein
VTPLDLLGALARAGRVALPLGLIAGAASPTLAGMLKPFLAEMAATLLFLAALRIGPERAVGGLRDLGATLGLTALYQLALPAAVAGAALAAGWSAPLAGGLVLMTAAPSIAGGPSLTALAGADPAPAMRLLVVGTALLPLTAVPAFWLSPALGGAEAVAGAAARLLTIIGGATALAFAVRLTALKRPSTRSLAAIDGVSVIALTVMVIGLMAAVGPALRGAPVEAARALAVAFAANFGLQLLVYALAGRAGAARVGFAVVAGNRNIALFLAALPTSVTDPMLLFIGCYQVPMYLTPLLLGPLYRRAVIEDSG